MPNYVYACETCEAVSEQLLPIANRHDPCNAPCASCQAQTVQLVPTAPHIGDPWHQGVTKLPPGFKDVLQRVKERVPGNKIDIRS
jgi:hypothetical protein